MRYLIASLLLLAFDASSETICVDKHEIALTIMLKEVEAERKKEIFHTLDKIDLILGFVEYGGEAMPDHYAFYDRMTILYLSSILRAISAAEEKGVKLDFHKNRLSQNFKKLKDLYRYFPETLDSDEYRKLSHALAAL